MHFTCIVTFSSETCINEENCLSLCLLLHVLGLQGGVSWLVCQLLWMHLKIRNKEGTRSKTAHWLSVSAVSRVKSVLILRCERVKYVDALVHVPLMTGNAVQNSCGKN